MRGCVTRYSCAIGTTGTRTPASRPSSAANIPPALTTTSASIAPCSVSTPVTRPSVTPIPVTRVWVKIRAPPARARLLGADELERQPEGPRPRGLAAQLLHALARGGQPQRADLAPAALLAE